MNYVIKAALSNAQHPEYGQITIPFPIPNDQYDQTIEKLQAAKLGFSVNRDCTVDEIDSRYPVLDALKGTMVNVDQLDYLAKRLDSFCKGEDAQFQAMAHKLEIAHIKDFINLTFCCQQATVITDFADLEKVGKDHVMILSGGSMPIDQYQAVDGRIEALRLIEGGGGTITPFGVVYDNGMELEQIYDGIHFPEYLYENSQLVLELSSKSISLEESYPSWLYLPMPDRQIQRAQLRAGISDPKDIRLRLVDSELPEMVLDIIQLEHEDIYELNRLCRLTAELDAAQRTKLEAVVLMTEAADAVSICQLAENLDQFDFIPGVHTPEEYGRHMIQESGHFEYDENLEGFYNYRRYGEQRAQQEGGQFNECGYVAYHGTMTLEELMMEDPAEQYQKEQGCQMGGLS